MAFVKHLFLISLGSLGLLGSGKIISRNNDWYDNSVSSSDLEQIFSLTKNAGDVSLSSDVDPNVSRVKSLKYVYSLFSTNLLTFSKNWSKYFYEWALYQWADWLLNNSPAGAFPEVKKGVFSAVNGVAWKPNQVGELPTSWTKGSNAISGAKNDLETQFLDFFFKDLFLSSSKTEISKTEISKTEEELKKYGHFEYAKAMVHFQKFVYEDWIKHEKPEILCKKEWAYSDSHSDNLYKEASTDNKTSRPDKPNIDFPDFKTVQGQITSFNTSGVCNDKEIFQISKLNGLDGRVIDAFISQYFSEIKKSNAPDGESNIEQGSQFSDTISDTISDINKIFVSDSEPTGAKISKAGKDVIDEKGTLKDDKEKHFTSFRKVKFGTDSKTGTYVKTEKGITFLHWVSSDSNFLSNTNLPKEQKLQDILKDYFKSKPWEIIGRYLVDQELSKSLNIFGQRTWGNDFYKMAGAVAGFLEASARNQEHWKSMVTLSNSIVKYQNVSFSSDKKAGFSAGLGLPLWMNKNLDKSSSVTSSVLDIKSKLKALDKNNNNGLFPLLKRYFSKGSESSKDWNMENLYGKSLELKEAMVEYLNMVKKSWSSLVDNSSGYSRSSFFFGDYILDNVYSEFLKKDSGKFISRATVSLALVNSLKIKSEIDMETFIKNRIIGNSGLSFSNEAEFRKGLLSSIKNIYYGSEYMKEPMKHRINYGGFKYQSLSSCVRKIKESSSSSSASSSKNEGCDQFEQTQSEWIQKLDDYWLMKNYVFDGHGYELGSQDFNRYLKFLYSFHELSKDKFTELRRFASSQIPNGEFGALVWIENVKSASEYVSSETKAGAPDNSGSTESLKSLDKYFRNPSIDEIFHPYFSKKLEVEETKSRPLSTGHVGAFAKTGKQEYTELFGFKGLYTRILNSNDLPENLKKAIFSDFHKSNPNNNKNFHMDNQAADNQGTSGYGYGKWNNEYTFDEFIDSFKKITTLKSFLQIALSSVTDDVWKQIEDMSEDAKLEYVKAQIKEKIKDEKVKQQIKNLGTRFSGFLQNPEKSDSQYKSQGFYIPSRSDGSSGNMVYITQVNKWDFENNEAFLELMKDVGMDTFMKSVIELSLNGKLHTELIDLNLIKKGIIV